MNIWESMTREQRVWVVQGHLSSAAVMVNNKVADRDVALQSLSTGLIFLVGWSSGWSAGTILRVEDIIGGFDSLVEGYRSDGEFLAESGRLAARFVDALFPSAN